MFHASQHLANHETFQPAFNRLNFFYSTCFQSDRSQRSRHFIGRQIEIDVLFQPIIRDIHIIKFFMFSKVTRKVNKIFWLMGNEWL